MRKKFFGTDGIRGHVGQFPITPDFMLRLGWAAGQVFGQAGLGRIVIGKDTRISGYMFESALEAGLVASGMDVFLTGPVPTPAIAYLTQTFRAQAGIVISASHNPYHDNGIKFFSDKGTKLSDATERQIEHLLNDTMHVVDSSKLGKVQRIEDAAGRYIEYCKGTVAPLNLNGLKIVIDAAHGAAYYIGPAVLRELGAEVIPLGDKPNGLNINDNVGSTCPAALQHTVIESGAHLGIALDGDGDRVVMVDHTGALIDGDTLLFIIALSMRSRGLSLGGVVGTVMTNLGIEQALHHANIPFARAQVGDRYVNDMLQTKGWNLGGESSGHIICRHISHTGDGLIAALQVLRALDDSQQTLHQWRQQVTYLPMSLINVPVTQPHQLLEHPTIQAAIQQAENRLADNGRVLLRASGTEPLMRVMVEGSDATQVNQVCKALAHIVHTQEHP